MRTPFRRPAPAPATPASRRAGITVAVRGGSVAALEAAALGLAGKWFGAGAPLEITEDYVIEVTDPFVSSDARADITVWTAVRPEARP